MILEINQKNAPYSLRHSASLQRALLGAEIQEQVSYFIVVDTHDMMKEHLSPRLQLLKRLCDEKARLKREASALAYKNRRLQSNRAAL